MKTVLIATIVALVILLAVVTILLVAFVKSERKLAECGQSKIFNNIDKE